MPETQKHKAWMRKKLDDGKVKCLACNRGCTPPPGKTTFCGVRKNIDGELFLLVYGKPTSINTDPVEKKPLYHFHPGSEILSIGTVGCNFRCKFCQNWHISQPTSETVDLIDSNNDKFVSPEEIVEFCKSRKIEMIAYTYNEPTIFFEYAFDIAKLAHENGIKNVFVSNGYETREALEKIRPYLDAVNTDLKSFDKKFYQKICGVPEIEPVKENIKWLFENKIWVEVTTLIIPGENDSEKELKQIAKFIRSVSPDIPWHISAYYPSYQMTNPPTPPETLEKAQKIGKEIGLNYVYVGNTEIENSRNTICPKCKETVIERNGYSTKNSLKNGKCRKCGLKIPGRF